MYRMNTTAHTIATRAYRRALPALLAILICAAMVFPAHAQWGPRKADTILKLCDAKDPQMMWMLVGYITGVMDKAFMDDVIVEAFTVKGNIPPQLTKILKAQIAGYCPPTNITVGDIRKAFCGYRASGPRSDLYLAPEWIQEALKRAYPCVP